MSDCRRHRHSYLCLLPVILSEGGAAFAQPESKDLHFVLRVILSAATAHGGGVKSKDPFYPRHSGCSLLVSARHLAPRQRPRA